MEIKDYYSILELKPFATQQEIKKAFRRLAQQLHPDKNNNDPYKAVQFAEIKEAYEVLINPAKKEFYLQQRWYYKSRGRKFSGNKTVTPVSILKQCLELNQYVDKLDSHRMDKAGLTEYIKNILSDDVIERLKTFNEPDINKAITTSLLEASKSLRYQQTEEIAAQLLKLSNENRKIINDTLTRHRIKERKEKYQPFIIILITIIICLLIFFVSR